MPENSPFSEEYRSVSETTGKTKATVPPKPGGSTTASPSTTTQRDQLHSTTGIGESDTSPDLDPEMYGYGKPHRKKTRAEIIND